MAVPACSFRRAQRVRQRSYAQRLPRSFRCLSQLLRGGVVSVHSVAVSVRMGATIASVIIDTAVNDTP